MGAFGEKLRRQREHRGISLEAVANTTKISTRMLRALEEEHFDQLPGGVFNKGFVRAYARQIGLNEQEAINDYLAALAESQIHSQPIIPNFRNTPARPAFETRAENKAENKPENKSSIADARVDRGDTAAADRRAPAERRVDARRVETRRTQDRLTGIEKVDDHLRRDRPPALPLNDPATNDRVKDARKNSDHENGNRLNPAFLAESPNQSQERGVDQAEPAAHSNALADDDLPTAPASFLNLSGPPQSYDEREEAVEENQPSARDEREEVAPVSAIRRSPTQPIAWRKLAIPLLLVVIIILFVVFLRRNHPAPQLEASSPPATPTSTTPSPGVPVAATPAAAAKVSAQNGSNASTSISSTAPLPSSPSRHPSSEKPAPTEPPSDVTKIIPSRAPPSKPKPLPAFTLIIRATENSSVAITADGQAVAQENLIAPAATSVRATKEIVVKAGNAAGVSFMLNGKDIPATGAEGQPHTYVFDTNGLRPGN
ncbi:MAG TPA: helix-turn-helix domain-containing protein [Candidatus Sulfotelmatobacter sp.]